jgi:choline-glycine betaine transporter
MEEQRATIDSQVFLVAAAVSGAFVLAGVLWTDELATIVEDALGWIVDNFGWFFVLSTVAFLIFVGFLALTRYGNIRLGKDDDRPEFRTVS